MRTRILFGAALFGFVLVFGCQKKDKTVVAILQVVDRRTGAPIEGARVLAYCGVPGDTNHYITDPHGKAPLDLRSFPGFAQIRADGYVVTNITVRSTNSAAIAFLEKVQ